MQEPNIVYDRDGITLLNNDFLEVDLSNYVGQVDLVITSPPYNVGTQYDMIDDKGDYPAYFEFTAAWLK